VIGPPVSVLTGLLPRGQTALTLILCLLLLAYLIWEWLQSFGKDDRWFQWTAAMTLTITNLIALRTATTNFVVLFPALVLIFALWHERWGKAGSVAILLAILCLLIGLWALFLITLEGNLESPAMYVPLPVLVLAGLWWSRWWVVRRHRF